MTRSSTARQLSTSGNSHALVIGAGIAGLSAAIAIRGLFDKVTIVDRSPIDDRNPTNPLATHAHMLLARGYHDLRRLIPDVDARLSARGITAEDCAKQIRWFTPLGWTPSFASGIKSFFAGRNHLASMMLDLIREDSRIEIRDLTTVTGMTRSDRAGISAVELIKGETKSKLCPTVIVNTSGRDGGAYNLLREQGFGIPKLVGRKLPVIYSSVLYEPKQGTAPSDWKILAVDIKCQPRRGAFCSREGDLVRVSLIGYAHDRNPQTLDEFEAFAKSLADPAVHDITQTHTAASELTHYRSNGDHYRDFSDVQFPGNVFCLGDTYAYSSPYYGRGMSMAIGAANELRDFLAADPDNTYHSANFHQHVKDAFVDPYLDINKSPGPLGKVFRKAEKSAVNLLWYRSITKRHQPSYSLLLSMVHMLKTKKDALRPLTVLQHTLQKEPVDVASSHP